MTVQPLADVLGWNCVLHLPRTDLMSATCPLATVVPGLVCIPLQSPSDHVGFCFWLFCLVFCSFPSFTGFSLMFWELQVTVFIAFPLWIKVCDVWEDGGNSFLQCSTGGQLLCSSPHDGKSFFWFFFSLFRETLVGFLEEKSAKGMTPQPCIYYFPGFHTLIWPVPFYQLMLSYVASVPGTQMLEYSYIRVPAFIRISCVGAQELLNWIVYSVALL